MSKGFLTSHGVIVAALSLSLVGCGQFGKLKASKHFKDANALYPSRTSRRRRRVPRGAIEADPELNEAYFFLAQQLRQPVQAGPQGQCAERQLPAGRAQELQDRGREAGRPQARNQAAPQAHAAVHGGAVRQGQAQSAGRSRAGRQAADRHGAERHRELLRAWSGSTRTPARSTDAEEILKQAQAAAPDKVDVWSTSAQFYNRKGEFDRAMEVVPADDPDRAEEPAELLPDGGVLRGEGPQGLHPQAEPEGGVPRQGHRGGRQGPGHPRPTISRR